MCISLIFSYSLMYKINTSSYTSKAKVSLGEILDAVSEDYSGGTISQEFKQNLAWTTEKTTFSLYLYETINELNENLPFEFDEKELITEEEKDKLLTGQRIVKLINTEKHNSETVVAVHPLLDGKNLAGVLLTYSLLSRFDSYSLVLLMLWFMIVLFFVLVMCTLSSKFLNRTFSPLKEIEQAALNVSEGNYFTKISNISSDEIGEVSKAFNQMSSAIREEQARREEFIADISHEIRTPLTYIKSYSHLLLDGLVENKDDRKKFLRLIIRETNRLHNLVQNLLDLNKMKANGIEINVQPVVFAQILEDIIIKYEAICQEKNLSLKFSFDYGMIINGDEERLEQIVQNIIDNAIKYSRDKGTIIVTLESKEKNCLLTIQDNGVGMSEEYLGKITNRYFRVSKTSSEFGGGTGIGLSIVEKLVALHGGQMKIESQLNVGTKVSLLFPILDDLEEGNSKVV